MVDVLTSCLGGLDGFFFKGSVNSSGLIDKGGIGRLIMVWCKWIVGWGIGHFGLSFNNGGRQ